LANRYVELWKALHGVLKEGGLKRQLTTQPTILRLSSMTRSRRYERLQPQSVCL